MKKILAAVLLVALIPVMEIKAADTWIKPEYVDLCEEIGADYGICPEILESIIEAESSGQQYASNGKCKGLTQIYESVWAGTMRKMGFYDIYDPRTNITMCAVVLTENIKIYGDDVKAVLMAYNGSTNVSARAERGDYSDYAEKVAGRAHELEELHGKHDYRAYLQMKQFMELRMKILWNKEKRL